MSDNVKLISSRRNVQSANKNNSSTEWFKIDSKISTEFKNSKDFVS